MPKLGQKIQSCLTCPNTTENGLGKEKEGGRFNVEETQSYRLGNSNKLDTASGE